MRHRLSIHASELVENHFTVFCLKWQEQYAGRCIVCPRISFHFPNTYAAWRIFSMTGTLNAYVL